jgi:photosystem II stability/assembly factor-like uncharacterized protein
MHVSERDLGLLALRIGVGGAVVAALETVDAGKTWHSYSSDYQDAAGVASVFVFGDPLAGYGSVRGGIRRTIDGGLHWSLIKTPGAT